MSLINHLRSPLVSFEKGTFSESRRNGLFGIPADVEKGAGGVFSDDKLVERSQEQKKAAEEKHLGILAQAAIRRRKPSLVRRGEAIAQIGRVL